MSTTATMAVVEVFAPRGISTAGRPPRVASAGPAHVRSGRGVRTTAETDEELREEAYENAVSAGYERVEWRTDGAGPNPYHLETSGERIGGFDKAAEMTKEIIEADGAYFLEPHQVASYLASSADDDYTAQAPMPRSPP